jgi:hypothetical protein
MSRKITGHGNPVIDWIPALASARPMDKQCYCLKATKRTELAIVLVGAPIKGGQKITMMFVAQNQLTTSWSPCPLFRTNSCEMDLRFGK